jgi:hypothetical protein
MSKCTPVINNNNNNNNNNKKKYLQYMHILVAQKYYKVHLEKLG